MLFSLKYWTEFVVQTIACNYLQKKKKNSSMYDLKPWDLKQSNKPFVGQTIVNNKVTFERYGLVYWNYVVIISDCSFQNSTQSIIRLNSQKS